MTANEMKFALQVEMVLNRIPQPEFRQLMVEAMMVLCLAISADDEPNQQPKTQWNETIQVEKIVYTANEIFVKQQVSMKGFFLL